MSFSLVKVIPQQVVAIGDDGKNKSSHLFDESLETRWSYKGGFAYNLIKLKELTALDSITFHWYMKKKERRVYRFGVYTTADDAGFGDSDFESTQKAVQNLYNSPDTVKSSNDDGNDNTTIQFDGKKVKTILVVYTHSSSKKSWFSVKEIQITGRTSLAGSECPDGTKWDPILGDCKEIMTDTDEAQADDDGVMLWSDEVGSYLSENHTFSRNFRSDGSMRMDIEKKDMGGKWRPDKEIVVFLKVSGKNPKEEVSAKLDGGPHNDKNPELGRCYDVGVSFDAKRLRLRVEDKHPHMIDYDEIDLTKLGLPALAGMYYGFCFTDRRVLQKSDNKLLGRIISVRVNPNPFDYNRNVLNDNWIDIGAFIDKGQYEIPVIEGPVDPEQYTDTIRVDGQDSATFGFRFLRYCQVEPIIAENKVDMESIFKEIREDFEEDAPVAETNLADVNVEIPNQIVITKEGDVVRLAAKVEPNPIITKVQWRQSDGKTIPLDASTLNSGYVEFPYKKEYGTTTWTFSVLAQGGITVFERSLKIIDAINQTSGYINPLYPDAKIGFKYSKIDEFPPLVANDSVDDVTHNDFEMTTVFTIGKQNVAHPYTIRCLPYIYEIYTDGRYTSGERTYPYMTNIPSLKGKKIGLKLIMYTTNVVVDNKTQRATLTEMHLNLNPDDKTFEYNPWFKTIQQPVDHPLDIKIIIPMATKFDVFEVREIQPPSIVRNI